jgi:hypothetical protein
MIPTNDATSRSDEFEVLMKRVGTSIPRSETYNCAHIEVQRSDSKPRQTNGLKQLLNKLLKRHSTSSKTFLQDKPISLPMRTSVTFFRPGSVSGKNFQPTQEFETLFGSPNENPKD